MKIIKNLLRARKFQLPRLAKIGFLSSKIGIRRARGKDVFMDESKKKK